MVTSEWLSATICDAVSALTVGEQAISQAREMAMAAGDEELHRRLHSEWMNDLLPRSVGRDGEWMAAVAGPDDHFLRWLRNRLAAPYHVSYRAKRSAVAMYGSEVVLVMAEMRWEQEIAWAERFRRSASDDCCLRAGLWLRSVRRDTGAAFLRLCQLRSETQEPAYVHSALHGWSIEDIAGCDEADLPTEWEPLWVQAVRKGPIDTFLDAMGDGERRRLAAGIRSAATSDAAAEIRRNTANGLRVLRPALLPAAIAAAVRMGLDADGLVETEKAFIAGIADGTVKVMTPAWRGFLVFLDTSPRLAVPPTAEERRLRTIALVSSGLSWARGLPQSLKDAGAVRKATLDAWRASCLSKPPSDPVASYAIWLAQNRRSRAAAIS